MKKTCIITGICICALGVIFELLFFLNARTKIKEYAEISGFIEQLNTEHSDNIEVYALYHGRLILKISSETTIKEMEDIVNEYEKWSSQPLCLKQILFVDRYATDTMMGVSRECNVAFSRSGEDGGFDTIDIWRVDSGLYPQLVDFSCYQELSESYRFNVFTQFSFDDTDDYSVISQWYCSPDVECEGEQYLIQSGVMITDERSDRFV